MRWLGLLVGSMLAVGCFTDSTEEDDDASGTTSTTQVPPR